MFKRLCLPLALLAGPAFAEGWSTTHLAYERSVDACMNKAVRVFDTYFKLFAPAAERTQSVWSVAGYDVNGPDIDSLIICPTDDGGVSPYIITYSLSGDDGPRLEAHNRLITLWEK